MIVLGIDTATSRVSVAIGEAGEVLGSVVLSGGRRHAEQLAPTIRALCAELDVRLDRISAIGVGLGPGLFTGLRVGVTTAKIMAQALRVPVVGISSLDLVAYPLRYCSRRIVVVLDARRHEVFDASYRSVPGGVQRVSEYQVRTPADLVADLEAEPGDILLAGDGARRYRGGARRVGARRACRARLRCAQCGRARRARDGTGRARGLRTAVGRPSDVPASERRGDRVGHPMIERVA